MIGIGRPIGADGSGDTRMPSLTDSSAEIRACPQVGFSRTMRAISARILLGNFGRPAFDLHFQNNLNPMRCHQIRVSGLTMSRAFLQRNSRDQNTRQNRVASSRRRGWIWCSA
jgi:hypothetical protein